MQRAIIDAHNDIFEKGQCLMGFDDNGRGMFFAAAGHIQTDECKCTITQSNTRLLRQARLNR